MESFPAISMFVLVGLYPFKYSRSLKKFKISLLRASYCTFVMLLFIGYDIHLVLFNICKLKSLYNDKTEENINRMEEILRKVDRLTWISMHCFSVMFVFIKMKGFCKWLNSLDTVVQQLEDFGFIKGPNSANKKISRNVFAILSWIGFCIYLGVHWSPMMPFKSHITAWIIGLHFPMIQMFEFVLFEKTRAYFASLHHNLQTRNHQKLHFWLKIHQELLKVSRMSCKLFAVTKVITLMGTVVLFSAYWFYNYDHFINLCVSFVWQFTMLPTFFLCGIWNGLNKEVSRLYLNWMSSL